MPHSHPRRTLWLLSFVVLVALAGVARANPALLLQKDGYPTLAPLLKKVTPAVVNIAVRAEVPLEQNPLFRDPFFRYFFNLPDRPPVQERQAVGSGVIIDAKKGLVLTNHHVIENATEVVVTLKDRRRFDAKVLGSDKGTDIALLKIEPDELTAVPVGDSDALEVGDLVVAIGNPFGLGQTVTSGIVSALGRSGLNIEGYEDFIQTDASINPGNSGGALVNARGELVGINTAIIAPGGGNVGIGFAVPTNMAMAVKEQLEKYGEVKRGRLGVLVQDLTPDLANALGLEVDQGAVVSQVQPGSPAAEAGLKAGDVIIAVNGKPVRGSADVRNRIGLMRVGTRVELTIIRDGEKKKVVAKVGSSSLTLAGEAASVPALQGARFRDLQPGDEHYGQLEGVLVEAIERGSPAARSGLRPGDVIVAVNRVRVHNVAELEKVLAGKPRVLALNIIRGNAQLFLVIR